jgi:hypothetical protein
MPDLLLFVQLPQLDNLVVDDHENLYLAAAYLEWAVRRSPLTAGLETARLPPDYDTAPDDVILQTLVDRAPRFVACTVYLWNLERTLALMKRLKRALPGVTVLLGGPEIARSHPLLRRPGAADILVVGEGERVLPELLHGLGTGRVPAFSCVAAAGKRAYVWGSPVPGETDLNRELPPPDWPGLAPDARGMAYVETSRGCPMRCTYCRYHQLRRSLSLLEPAAVAARVLALREKGAREIRFVDPTFNAHPRFTETLRLLGEVNRDGRVAFFAELRADRLTEEQADLLAAARFTDIESGVQSLEPDVLAAIGRPADPVKTGDGIRRMAARGIRVTLDLMIGLPFQTKAHVDRALDWALGFPRSVNIQCMHTLLLPGTILRKQALRLGIRADPLPPYAVLETPWMSRADLLAVENRLTADPRLRADTPTTRFVGHALPELFADPVLIPVPWRGPEFLPKGPARARQAWVFRGTGLFAHARLLAEAVRGAIRASPYTLWQFVLEPDTEEPLDLLDSLTAAIRAEPPMIVDRYASVSLRSLTASRRLFIRLRRGRSYDPGWVEAARDALEASFF